MKTKIWFSIDEASQYLGISRQAVSKLIMRNRLPSYDESDIYGGNSMTKNKQPIKILNINDLDAYLCDKECRKDFRKQYKSLVNVARYKKSFVIPYEKEQEEWMIELAWKNFKIEMEEE